MKYASLFLCYYNVKSVFLACQQAPCSPLIRHCLTFDIELLITCIICCAEIAAQQRSWRLTGY